MEQRIWITVTVLALLVPGLAHAQCSPVPVIVTNIPLPVSDAPVEASVTTPTTATFTTDDMAYSVISTQSFQQEFPGWVRLPVNSRDIAQKNVMDTLSTFLAVDTDTQTHMANITALSNQHDPAVLAAIQTLTVVVANQSQIMANLTHLIAVSEAEKLNAEARVQATQATTWSEWFASVI